VTPLVTEVITERIEFPNESMVEFDVAAKIEVDCMRVSVTKNYTMVIDPPPTSGSPVKALPKPKPPDRDASGYEDVISTKLPPHPSEQPSDPPEPPYSDSVVTIRTQPKPRDSDQLDPTLPLRCNVEKSKTYGIKTTNCLTKCLYMMPHYRVDFCFNSNCVTHNSTTKDPHCEFSPLAANTTSFAMSQTKPPGGSLFSIECIMASPWEELARRCCSLTHLVTTAPLQFKEEVVMNLVSLRWFYNLHIPPPQLDPLILKLDFRPPAKPPDHYNCIEDDKMVLRDQVLTLVFTIEAWLQVIKVVCNGLQQVLFLKQLGCIQHNNVKSRSSTKYITVQVIQLADIAVTGTFITLPFLLKFTCDMNLKYKEGLLNPVLTYDVGSYWFVQNLFAHVFSWCSFVTMVYKQFAISEACELKCLLIEIERNNFSSVLTNSACSKLKELDDSIHIGRYITVGFVVPNFIGKNTLIARVAACGGINTGDNVFHNMQIKD
jgi:hypothetical protein